MGKAGAGRGAGSDPDVARGVVAAWLEVPPVELAAVQDGIVERIARRLLDLRTGAADTDAAAAEAVLGDVLRELHRRATVDALTGVLTRGATEQRLASELVRAERYGRHLSILLVDLDRLKQVNDAHGHPTGDALLRAVALELSRSIRATDVIGRWGGDEFMVICPEASEEAAGAVAEKVVHVAREVSVLRGGGVLPSSVSVGWACAPGGGLIDVVVGRADVALYRAKLEGGDRAVGFRPEER